MPQSIILWTLGVLFLAAAPVVTHKTDRRAEVVARYVFIVLGALCVRLA